MQKMARQSAAMKKGLPFLNWIQETRETTVHLCVKGRACLVIVAAEQFGMPDTCARLIQNEDQSSSLIPFLR